MKKKNTIDPQKVFDIIKVLASQIESGIFDPERTIIGVRTIGGKEYIYNWTTKQFITLTLQKIPVSTSYLLPEMNNKK